MQQTDQNPLRDTFYSLLILISARRIHSGRNQNAFELHADAVRMLFVKTLLRVLVVSRQQTRVLDVQPVRPSAIFCHVTNHDLRHARMRLECAHLELSSAFMDPERGFLNWSCSRYDTYYPNLMVGAGQVQLGKKREKKQELSSRSWST